jgi:hypothetical protein
MINLIRKYYLPPFIGALFIFLPMIFIKKSPNSFLENVLICLGGAIITATLLGVLSFFIDTRWEPAKRKKRMLKSPFKELFQNGFVREDDLAIGNVREYTVIVQYFWSGGKYEIKLDILFDMGLYKMLTSASNAIKEIEKRNKPNRFTAIPYQWTMNSVGCIFEYSFRPPSYEKLIKKANELIDVLKNERLSPMSYDKAITLNIPGPDL